MRARAAVVLVVLLTIAACTRSTPATTLAFTVTPTPTGADVEERVQGGPTGRVWVGFGVGPGVDARRAERVSAVRAVSADGSPLAVRPHGEAGYEIDLDGGASWRLAYSMDLRPEAEDGTFYRASVRDDDYLVMVGSDMWARIYADPAPLSFRPDNRPPGRADTARVTVDLPGDSDWVVVGAGRRSFRLAEHPAASVLVAGRFDSPHEAPGLSVRIHPAWQRMGVAPGDMATALITRLRERMGPADDQTAVAVMMPLPGPLRPAGGLRTAGMVRDHTALLYGGLASGPRPPADRIEAAVAVFIAHELFHLYVPSAIQVTRDLSWLSEGWAMHMGRLAAHTAGYVDDADVRREIEQTYRRYLDMGGYRAGSLPAASMGSESKRDLLYLRGELVFRLLAREWDAGRHDEGFDVHLWRRLQETYRGEPLGVDDVHGILAEMVDTETLRRYVMGTAPLTEGVLGLDD